MASSTMAPRTIQGPGKKMGLNSPSSTTSPAAALQSPRKTATAANRSPNARRRGSAAPRSPHSISSGTLLTNALTAGSRSVGGGSGTVKATPDRVASLREAAYAIRGQGGGRHGGGERDRAGHGGHHRPGGRHRGGRGLRRSASGEGDGGDPRRRGTRESSAGRRSDATQVQAVVDRVVREHARIDILVNAVGGSTIIARPAATVDELTLADWQRLLAFNLDGTFLFCHAVAPVTEAPAGRKDRQHLVHRGAGAERGQQQRLRGGQGWHHRLHAQAGPRAGAVRGQRQRHRTQPHADRADLDRAGNSARRLSRPRRWRGRPCGGSRRPPIRPA